MVVAFALLKPADFVIIKIQQIAGQIEEYAGPMFQQPIAVRVGETLERDGFAYADIVPID